MNSTTANPTTAPELPELCPECRQTLTAQAASAKPNAVGSIQWCGHHGVHGLLLREALIQRSAATPAQAEALDRAYAASLSQLIALEQALLAALHTDQRAN